MYDWQDKDWKRKRDKCLEYARADGIDAEISNNGVFVVLYCQKDGKRHRMCDIHTPNWHDVGLIEIYGENWEKIGSTFSPEEAYEICKKYCFKECVK